MTAAAYILKVPYGRREYLLDLIDAGERKVFSEPVPQFDHSRREPLIVLACFDDEAITHIADGRKGASAGTGLVRLNMSSLEQLRQPIKLGEIRQRAPTRVRAHLARMLEGGGKLPPKSLGAMVDILLESEPGLSARLAQFSARRATGLAALTLNGRANLAVQKETLSLALQIAGIGTEDVLMWSPTDSAPRSFLDGLPGARVREDTMLLTDFADVPGFEAIRSHPFAVREFQSVADSTIHLTVIMANRLALEEQTGADRSRPDIL